MNEFLQFFTLLKRNRTILILVPLVTVVLCFFLVRELPDVYKSHGSISTGLVDKSEQILSNAEKDQDSEINRKFDNLIQMMLLKKVLDQVSYQLLLHDLKSPEDKKFSKDGKTIQSLSKVELSKYISIITKKHNLREEILPGTKESDVIIAMLREKGYDHASINSKISIYRVKSSDYISIDSEADSPELAQFLINTLTSEFVAYSSSRLVDNNKRAIDFLAGFLSQKREALTERMNTLRTFKIKNRVLNLNEQARSLYGQMADFETKLEGAEKDIIAYAAAVRKIDSKFNPSDRRYLESALTGINMDIVATKEQLKVLNENYIRSNFDERLKTRVDSLRRKLAERINESSDRYVYNPMVVKENLVNQKLTLETELELATNSVSSIQKELVRLNRKFDALVPNEAQIQEFETSIDIASKEYMEALQRYNNITLESNFPVYLKQAEKAMPGVIQPSKKMVLLILSGVISIAFCLFVFFVLFYFDNSIKFPAQLANETGLPVLGYLNYVAGGVDLGKIQDESTSEKHLLLFRNLIRSIRYEIDSEYPGAKVVVLTSLEQGDGKTLLAVSLAWAFSRVNKKVLIIDGNFSNQNVSHVSKSQVFLETLLSDNAQSFPAASVEGISVLGKKGGDTSVNEIASEEQVRHLLTTLKNDFDVIIVEADSMLSMNKAKEWALFADAVVAVVAVGKTIKTEDKNKIDYFRSLGNKFAGWVLTGTRDLDEQSGKTTK